MYKYFTFLKYNIDKRKDNEIRNKKKIPKLIYSYCHKWQ